MTSRIFRDEHPVAVIREIEFAQTIPMMVKKNIAPDTNGIHGRALKLEIRELNNKRRRLLNVRLGAGEIHQTWITASLTPVQKEEKRLTDSPSTYRPICLLEMMRKLLERFVSYRINANLSCGP